MKMSSNLANVYANIWRKYGDNYMVTYAVPPTYLNSIASAAENPSKIILLCVEDRSKGNLTNFVSPSKLNIKKSTNVDLDLTGSPLKDECVVDPISDISLDLNLITSNPWKLEEEYHRGISVDKARAIISEDFQNVASAADAVCSIWLLCSGTDYSKTLFLQYEIDGNRRARGIILYKGIIPFHAVTSQYLLKEHFSIVGKDSRAEIKIENIYNIKPNISIKCSWSTTSANPSLIELRTCDVHLKQTFCFGNSSSSTQEFILQLRILMAIRDEIISYKQSENLDLAKEPIYSSGIGVDMVELHKSINKVMTEITEIDTNSGTDRDIEDVIQTARIRHPNDLTDKLWVILKECSSYKDLKIAYNILFQCAARCNIVNTPTNKNRLAEMITEVANRRLAIPCLSGSEPLELLLEIGMEKIYKDYEYIFVESKICSATDLRNKSIIHDNKENDNVVPNVRKSLRNAVMQDNAAMRKTLLHNDIKSNDKKIEHDMMCFKNSNFDEQESAKTLAKLLQIHCTLEHLLMIHINLNLSNIYFEVCDQLLRKAPRCIDSICDSLSDEIELQLSAYYIRTLLEDRHPHSRRIIMKSKNKLREVKSTFYFNIENVCPPNISECFNADEKECCKEKAYYYWLYRKIIPIKNN